MYKRDLHVDWFAICKVAQCTWWIAGWWEMSNFNAIVISFIFAPGGSTFSIPTTDKLNFKFFVKAISCGRMTWYLTQGRGCPGTNSSTSLSSIYEQKIRLVTIYLVRGISRLVPHPGLFYIYLSSARMWLVNDICYYSRQQIEGILAHKICR